MEYVMLLVVGLLVSSLIVGVFNSEPVQEAMKQAIACKFDAVDENGKSICKDPKYARSDYALGEDQSKQDSNSPPDLQKNQQATSTENASNEDKGFFEQLGDDFNNVLDKAKQGIEEFVNDPWTKTKEVASDAWDGITEAANDAWEWTKENKEYIAAGVTIAVGVVLCFIVPPVGAGILIGAAVSGGISAAQGNDLKTIMGDAAIGGIAGAVGGGVAGGVVRGVVRYVGQKAAQLIGNAAGGAAGSLADDFLRGKKFNWKNAALSAVLAVGVTHGVQAAQKAAPVFGITPKAQYTANQAAKSSTKLETGVVIKGKKIVKVNNVPKYKPATNNVDLNHVAKVRKELGLPAIDEEKELIEKGILKNGNTVAVLEADGKQIWGRSGWGVNKEGYSAAKNEWAKGKIGKTGVPREKAATNAQTLTHAEGDVFWHLYQYRKVNNILGGSARMAVDRPLCRSCGDLKGIQNLVEEVGLDKLEIVSPEGTQVIRPRAGQRRTQW